MTLFTARVAANDDDAFENAGTVDLSGEELHGQTDRMPGVRFTSVTVPNGATIDDAKVTWNSRGSASSALEVDCHMEDADDPPTFTTGASDISNRTKTSPAVAYTVQSWTDGNEFDTPDLAVPVKTVVDRAGWVSGQAMVGIFPGLSANFGNRTWADHEFDTTRAPLLTINYTEAAAVGHDYLAAYIRRRSTSQLVRM